MRRTPTLIAITALSIAALSIAALSGCASSGSPDAGNVTPASGPAPAADQAPSAAPDPAPDPAASTVCTTHACIAQDLDQSLVGGVAKDEAVATKVTCYKKTVVFHQAADSYSATCLIEYSDGSSAEGTGNLLVKQQQVTFEPSL